MTNTSLKIYKHFNFIPKLSNKIKITWKNLKMSIKEEDNNPCENKFKPKELIFLFIYPFFSFLNNFSRSLLYYYSIANLIIKQFQFFFRKTVSVNPITVTTGHQMNLIVELCIVFVWVSIPNQTKKSQRPGIWDPKMSLRNPMCPHSKPCKIETRDLKFG